MKLRDMSPFEVARLAVLLTSLYAASYLIAFGRARLRRAATRFFGDKVRVRWSLTLPREDEHNAQLLMTLCIVAACAIGEGCRTSQPSLLPAVTLHPFAEPDAAGDVVFPKPDHLPSPLNPAVCAYPPSMLKIDVSGEVTLSFIVASDGSVRDVWVINSTDISFADAAKQGVLRQRYSPATAGCQPIDCRVHLAIKFTATPGSQITTEPPK
jgi:TonB family protein